MKLAVALGFAALVMGLQACSGSDPRVAGPGAAVAQSDVMHCLDADHVMCGLWKAGGE